MTMSPAPFYFLQQCNESSLILLMYIFLRRTLKDFRFVVFVVEIVVMSKDGQNVKGHV